MRHSRPLISIITLMVLVAAVPTDSSAEEIVLNEQAKGFVESLKKTLETIFPKIGRTILGVKVELSREVQIEHIGFDTETAVVAVRAKVRYYTSDAAVINMAGLGIDHTTNFDTKYNVQTNDLTKLKVTFTLPKGWGGIDVNLDAIKRVLEGDLAAALELIPNGGLVKRDSTSEYDAKKKWFQDKYGTNNVYFASSDFVRWASPETAGEWVLGLIASGGSSAGAIATEVREQIRKELTHITFWLKKVGASSAESIAQDLISGKPVAIPEMKLVWQRVIYKSAVVVAGRKLPEIEVPHAAFVLVWKLPSTSTTVTFNPSTEPLSDDNSARPKWRLGARYALGATGSRIVFVSPGGPADNAGLKPGDVVIKASGTAVGVSDNATDLLIRKVKASEGPTIDLEVLSSGGSTQTIQVTLEPIL